MEQSKPLFDIFVVDNNSSDFSADIIEKEYPMCTLIRSGENNGFSLANNIGVDRIMNMGYSYVILLNEDTVCDRKMVEELYERRNERMILTPAIYLDRLYRRVWGGGSGYIDYCNAKPAYTKDFCKELTEVTFATGCCMMISCSLIQEIGLFDTDYYMYWEDTDLSARFYTRGVKIYVVEAAKLWHRGQRNLKGKYKDYYKIRNRWLFIKKNANLCKITVSQAIAQDIIRYIVKSFPDDIELTRYFIYGMRDYLLKKFGKGQL